MNLYLQLVEKKLLKNENISEYILKLTEQSKRITRLVDDLLDLSRIQSNKLDFEFGNFRLDKIVEDQVETVQSITEKHVIVIKANPRITIHGDKDRITQVITNLLTNAIKYSLDGGEIEVVARKAKHEVIVSVKDEGVGIDVAHHKKIFDRLFQVEENKEKQRGLGMGLYICSEIIKKHNGKIWVESEKGKGSTFYFNLPLQAPKT